MEILTYKDDDARRPTELARLATSIFESFDVRYIHDRINHIADPILHVAVEDGRWTGFKLAYRRGGALYSWLGGVTPDMRGRGVARELMTAQHETARSLGYACVETRTRASNNPMIILNLQSGFEIVALEVDRAGFVVLTQRKVLERNA